MAKLTTAEFIEAIKELTVLELNDLVKACEEEFGVSAAAGVLTASSARKNTGKAGVLRCIDYNRKQERCRRRRLLPRKIKLFARLLYCDCHRYRSSYHRVIAHSHEAHHRHMSRHR